MRGTYEIDGSSALFPEMWSMYAAWLSSAATVSLKAQQASALRVMGMVAQKALALGGKAPREGDLRVEVSFFEFPDRLQIKADDGEALVIRGARTLLDKVSLPNQSPPTELGFELLAVEALAAEENYERPMSHSHKLPDRYLADLWGYIIAGAYERNEQVITQRYGSTRDVKVWPTELQVFHHVRNAAFHGGTFNIWKSRNKIDYAQPPSWHRYTIASEDAVAGRYAIGDFLPMVHVLPFVRDISLALDAAKGP